MNRTLALGVAILFAVIGIALMGGEKRAEASFGCHGCDGAASCAGDCAGNRCCGRKARCCGRKARCGGRDRCSGRERCCGRKHRCSGRDRCSGRERCCGRKDRCSGRRARCCGCDGAVEEAAPEEAAPEAPKEA